jgi:hypothetical protein
MGRKKKYQTEEELIEANKRWCMEYYERNKELMKEKNKKRYHDRKRKEM